MKVRNHTCTTDRTSSTARALPTRDQGSPAIQGNTCRAIEPPPPCFLSSKITTSPQLRNDTCTSDGTTGTARPSLKVVPQQCLLSGGYREPKRQRKTRSPRESKQNDPKRDHRQNNPPGYQVLARHLPGGHHVVARKRNQESFPLYQLQDY